MLIVLFYYKFIYFKVLYTIMTFVPTAREKNSGIDHYTITFANFSTLIH